MVVTLAFSTKAAITLGALVGGTVAILANKEKILEISAEMFQKAADFCNEQIEKNKIEMAAHLRDGEYNFEQNEDELSLPQEHAETPNTEDLITHSESETDDVLTDNWEEESMDGWQLAHLSESDFSESYEEIDSEPVSRVTTTRTNSYGGVSLVVSVRSVG